MLAEKMKEICVCFISMSSVNSTTFVFKSLPFSRVARVWFSENVCIRQQIPTHYDAFADQGRKWTASSKLLHVPFLRCFFNGISIYCDTTVCRGVSKTTSTQIFKKNSHESQVKKIKAKRFFNGIFWKQRQI